MGGLPFVVREGRIDVEGVSFAYPNGTLALKNVSLRVEGGTKVALVGQTGSGKSTLLALFVRLFTDYSGTIRIDGQDIREVDLSSLRRQVVLVSQDVFLFSGTVMDNLRCGDSMISEEEILEVTKALGAHEFILALPNGYETQIGERGIKLSGGQKQLLALARAVPASAQDPSFGRGHLGHGLGNRGPGLESAGFPPSGVHGDSGGPPPGHGAVGGSDLRPEGGEAGGRGYPRGACAKGWGVLLDF
jgi:ABC-type ATPase involved in cell division